MTSLSITALLLIADYDVYQPCYQSTLHDAIIHQCDSYTYDIPIRSFYYILQCR